MKLLVRVVGVRQLFGDLELVHARLDGVLQLLHRGVAILLLLLEALEDDRFVGLRNLRVERARVRRRNLN